MKCLVYNRIQSSLKFLESHFDDLLMGLVRNRIPREEVRRLVEGGHVTIFLPNSQRGAGESNFSQNLVGVSISIHNLKEKWYVFNILRVHNKDQNKPLEIIHIMPFNILKYATKWVGLKDIQIWPV